MEDSGVTSSWIEDLALKRNALNRLARQLAEELDTKKKVLEGRLVNATRLCAEAEGRLARTNREYQSKNLTLRKRMLSIVGTLGTASFLGWILCAFITQKFPLGAVLILPTTLVIAILLCKEEGGLLGLAAWSG